MPVVGRNKKAKPLAVWDAFNEYFPRFEKAYPKPGRNESFTDYMARIDWKEEAIFCAVIGVGCTTDGSDPNQRDYLQSLELMAEVLFKIRAILLDKFPSR